MRFIDFESGASAQSLIVSETAIPAISKGQVLVRVAAFGINRADILQRQGHYPAPRGESPILGLEMAGEIVQMSQDLADTSGFTVGDKVFGLVAGGAYAEYVAVDVRHLLAQPKHMSSEQAAGMAECFLTAYQAMFVEYNLALNSHVLIHAGASGVGLAAIQLAKLQDCHIAVTASGAEKLQACSKNGANLLINYRETDFVEVLAAYPRCDLIIDFIGADYVRRNLSVINQDGCIIQLAMLGGRRVEHFDLALLLSKRVTLKGSTLRSRCSDYKANLIAGFKHRFGTELTQQKLQANIDQCYAAAEVSKAHQYMENNSNIGKLVCRW